MLATLRACELLAGMDIRPVVSSMTPVFVLLVVMHGNKTDQTTELCFAKHSFHLRRYDSPGPTLSVTYLE